MRIIKLETLKTMPNGTVFCEQDDWGNLKGGIKILTGRFEDRQGFNGVMGLYPCIRDERKLFIFGENGSKIEYQDVKTSWSDDDTADHEYDKGQMFAVFSKKEVAKMIKALQWALSGLEDDFDMDEVLE